MTTRTIAGILTGCCGALLVVASVTDVHSRLGFVAFEAGMASLLAAGIAGFVSIRKAPVGPSDLRVLALLWSAVMAMFGFAMVVLEERTFGMVVLGVAVLCGAAGWVLMTRKFRARLQRERGT